MTYLLDANVFIQAKNLHYGFDFCPAFWEWMKKANSSGSLFSIEKVSDELLAGTDELSDWAQQQGNALFVPPDGSVIPALTTVSTWATSQGYEAAAVSTFLQVADYWLVAHALAHDFTIVTHEVPAASARKIKIPNACLGLGISFMSPYEMLRREHARFVLDEAWVIPPFLAGIRSGIRSCGHRQLLSWGDAAECHVRSFVVVGP